MRYLDIRGAGLGGYVGVNLFFSHFYFLTFTSLLLYLRYFFIFPVHPSAVKWFPIF